MQQQYPFDPSEYFAQVADTLLRNHGDVAIVLADRALKRMRNMGDDRGFNMWLGVHEQLTAKAPQYVVEENAVVH